MEIAELESENLNWKPISVASCYEISNTGIVRRKVKGKHNRVGIIKPSKKGRYHSVSLQTEKGEKTFTVHRLVCEAFHGESKGRYALHRDDNRSNNTVDNLYWGTQKENLADRKRNGHGFEGEKHPRAKLTLKDVGVIRGLEGSISGDALGRRYGVTGVLIRKIWKRELWNH